MSPVRGAKFRVGIVGGGPAGLVAAIAASKAGFGVTVYEQAPSFERIGGAIGIQSNGMRVLDALGLMPRFRQHIELVYRARVEAPPGHTITSIDYQELDLPHRGFAVALRYDLQELLLAAAREEGADIRFGVRCARAVSNGDSVRLSFTNGATDEVNLALACDGARSAVRAAGAFRSRTRQAGQAFLRVIAPIEHPDRERIGEFWAPDRRAGAFPLPGPRTYVFCSVPMGEWAEIRTQRLTGWIESWRDFGDPIYPLIRSVTDWGRAVYDELQDVRVGRWWKGRVILLGDAAHAMTPNLGQGANSAMVDGLILINLLVESATKGSEQAARRYEQLRKPFVKRLQNAAWLGGQAAHWRSGYARALRDGALRLIDRVGPVRRESMRLAAGYNPAEDPYLHPPVRIAGS
ncbi:MAG TPA: NAD(P)/FAD-dependent oxidoreductase [Longimicrobiales bacterium]|nr:NAD(P)/FAD-dependent oxidoreductase [Longimicrobiales bacterium]